MATARRRGRARGAARGRELRWAVGTIVVLLVLAAAVPVALPFLTALGAER
ncbi:hypothetical protein [Xylanimonas protaetiae]|uniref:hypothetical protein n=1 Tax=Xylanimonas protaetiae TaxID=2509457 RepID=UPI0013ECF530|nr:hypothetical protein [Xylanimonas protaetiae]